MKSTLCVFHLEEAAEESSTILKLKWTWPNLPNIYLPLICSNITHILWFAFACLTFFQSRFEHRLQRFDRTLPTSSSLSKISYCLGTLSYQVVAHRIIFTLVCSILLAFPAHGHEYQYETISFAGSGAQGWSDGGSTAAAFFFPIGVSVDTEGYTYVADRNNHRIRKVSPAGIVSTTAGSGSPTWADGVGVLASFFCPCGVAITSSGVLYVSDQYNHRIRMIVSTGTVSTIAGSGSASWVDGSGISAAFNYPCGISVSSSNAVYVSDTLNHRIRRVLSSGVVTTFAGSGVADWVDGVSSLASFNNPTDVSVDSSGNVYVADQSNNRIRKITSSGSVMSVAGSGQLGCVDGSAATASFSYPAGVAADLSGSLLIADQSNNRIRQVSSSGVVTTLAGSGEVSWADGIGTLASFSYPQGIAVDTAGNIYVADKYYGNNRIRLVLKYFAPTG